MSDKITLPGQLQHSNSNFAIIDVNDIRGGIKSVDIFDSNSLVNLHTSGVDKFLADHTLILERSSNSFFWMSGLTSSDIASWTPISIEQDNRFRYIRLYFSVGGRGVPVEQHEQLIEDRIQDYFDNNSFVIEDTELIIFVFTITEYGLFQTHERKYTFPDMLGKGTYDDAHSNTLQYSDLELMYKSGSGTTTEDILTGSVNNIIVDLGDITGDELINYVNNNGDTYDFSDMTKIYYFKFTLDSVEYIYYFEGDDSVNGYGLYGLGEFQFDVTDLTLFSSSDAPIVSPTFNQDNRFRFVEFKVTLKAKKQTPTISNTVQLLRDQVNNLFANQTLRVYETELIIFKFHIIDPRVSGVYIWKYFFKHMQGKGNYSPIYPTITFDQLEVAHQDLSFLPATPVDVAGDINNIIFEFGDVTGNSNFDNFQDDIDNSINSFLESEPLSLDMTDPTKIYFFDFTIDGVDYLYYYSGNTYGTYGFGGLDFTAGDILLFYNSSIFTTEPSSINNNVPRTYRILSTDIDKPLLDIDESDVINYINNINGPVIVDEYDSMMIFDVYQPQIDIQFGNINNTGIPELGDRYLWDSWINNGINGDVKNYNNLDFTFSDVEIYGNTVSLIGDLNEIESFALFNYNISGSFSRIKFGSSSMVELFLQFAYNSLLDVESLNKLERITIESEMVDTLILTSPYIDYINFDCIINNFTFPIQATKSATASYNMASTTLTELDLENMLYNLVQSPVSNIGEFHILDYFSMIFGTNSNSYITTLEGRGWIFDDDLDILVPILPTTTAPPEI